MGPINRPVCLFVLPIVFDALTTKLPHTLGRGVAVTKVGHLRSFTFNIGRLHFRTIEDSSLRTCSPAVWADAKTAVGRDGSFGNDAYQLSIGLFLEGTSAGFAQVGTHTSSSAMSYATHPNPKFSKQKVDFS